jgi:hypothetical protein
VGAAKALGGLQQNRFATPPGFSATSSFQKRIANIKINFKDQFFRCVHSSRDLYFRSSA